MSDDDIIGEELVSIVSNNRIPIKKKKELIKKRLIAINTFLELVPNDINNKKKKKINNLLMKLPSIKYNVDLKKVLTPNLINYLTTFKNSPNIILSQLKKELEDTENIEDNSSETSSDVETVENHSILNKMSMIHNYNSNSKSNSKSEVSVESEESDSETEQETDEELESEDEDDELESEEDLLDGTVNNLMEDLSDEDKIKLIMKITKCKLNHVYIMEVEKNRNMERMEELKIKKLKIKNKYKIKKLENRN